MSALIFLYIDEGRKKMHLLWHMLARPVTLQDSLRHTCCLSVHMAVPKIRVVVVVVLGVDVIVGMSMA